MSQIDDLIQQHKQAKQDIIENTSTQWGEQTPDTRIQLKEQNELNLRNALNVAISEGTLDRNDLEQIYSNDTRATPTYVRDTALKIYDELTQSQSTNETPVLGAEANVQPQPDMFQQLYLEQQAQAEAPKEVVVATKSEEKRNIIARKSAQMNVAAENNENAKRLEQARRQNELIEAEKHFESYGDNLRGIMEDTQFPNITPEFKKQFISNKLKRDSDQKVADANYYVEDVIKDSALSIAKGTVSLAQLIPLGSVLLTDGKVGTDTLQTFTNARNWLGEQQSEKLQKNLIEIHRKTDREFVQNQALRIINNEDDGFINEARDFLDEFGTAFTQTAKSPAALLDVIVEQIPSILTGGAAAKKIIKMSTKKHFKKRGIDSPTPDQLNTFLSSAKGKRTQQKLAGLVGSSVGGLEEGGSLAIEAVNEVMNMTYADLEASSPLYRELMASGNLTKKQARLELATSIGAKTFALGTLFAGVISKVSGAGQLEGSLLLDNKGKLAKFGSAVTRESGEEGVQGVAGQGTANYLLKDADETKVVREGLAIESALGTLAGGGTGAVISALTETGEAAGKAVEKMAEVAAKKSEEIKQKATVQKAIKTGDVTEVTNEESENYDPVDATVAVLKQKEDAPIRENKRDYLNELNTHISNAQLALDKKIDDLSDAPTPEEIEDLQTEALQLGELNDQVAGIQQLESSEAMNEAKKLLESVEPTTPEDVNKTVGRVLYSINSYTQKDVDDLDALLNVEGIDEESKAIISKRSEYLKSIGEVSQDIRTGRKEDGFIGFETYESNIGEALARGNTTQASKLLTGLNKFAERHTVKAKELLEGIKLHAKLKGLVEGSPQHTAIQQQLADIGERYPGIDGTPFSFENPKGARKIAALVETEAQALNNSVKYSSELIALQGGDPKQTPTQPAKEVAPVEEVEAQAETDDEQVELPEAEKELIQKLSQSSLNSVDRSNPSNKQGIGLLIKLADKFTEILSAPAFQDIEGYFEYDTMSDKQLADLDALGNKAYSIGERLDKLDLPKGDEFKDLKENLLDKAGDLSDIYGLRDALESIVKYATDVTTASGQQSLLDSEPEAVEAPKPEVKKEPVKQAEATQTEQEPVVDTSKIERNIKRTVASTFGQIKARIGKSISHQVRTKLRQMAEADPETYNDFNKLEQIVSKMYGSYLTGIVDDESSLLEEFAAKLSKKKYKYRSDTDMLLNGKPVGNTKKPLSEVLKVKNTKKSSLLLENEDVLSEYEEVISQERYTDSVSTEEQEHGRTILGFAREFANVFTSKVFTGKEKNPKYYEESPINYLVNEDTGELSENTLTAIATTTMQWLTTKASDTVHNDDEAIRSILGLQEWEEIPKEARKSLQIAGTLRVNLIETLGRDIIKTLNIEPRPGIEEGFLGEKLEHSLGKTALATLMHMDILEDVGIENSIISSWRSDSILQADDKRLTHFVSIKKQGNIVQLNNGKEIIVPSVRQDIAENIEKYKESLDTLESMFGVEVEQDKIIRNVKDIPTPKDTVQGTFQKVPKEQLDIIDKHNKRPLGVKKVWDVVSKIGKEAMYEIAGVSADFETTTQKNLLDSVKGVNNDAIRSVDNMFNFVTDLGNKRNIFYVLHEKWKNDRLGMKRSNGISIQGDKNHRHVFGYTDQRKKVDPSDSRELQGFYLAVAQGLDIDIDKISNQEAISELTELLGQPDMMQALDLLGKSGSMEAFTQAETDIIVKAVKKGKLNAHSLDALYAMATHLKNPSKPFNTDLFIEMDGITNGVMITVLQLGTTQKVKKDDPDTQKTLAGIQSMLDAGGIFSGGFKSFAEYKAQGNQDSYEQLAGAWSDKADNTLKGMNKKASESASALMRFVGKIERKLAKDPLMVLIYGANIKNVIKNFKQKSIDSIYEQIQKEFERIESVRDTKDYNPAESYRTINLNLSILFKEDVPVQYVTEENALDFSFSKQEENYINNMVDVVYGDSLAEAVNKLYGDISAVRNGLNKMLKVVFEGFKLKYDQAIDRAIKDKRAKYGSKAQLSREERKEITLALLDHMPIVKSFFSTQNSEGILVMKKDKKRLYDPKDNGQSSTNFKEPVPYTKLVRGDNGIETKREEVDSKTGEKKTITSTSMTSYISIDDWLDGGVSGAVLNIHSIDAATMFKLLDEHSALNVHDAIATSVDISDEATIAINKYFLEVNTQHSVLKEVHNTLVRTMALLNKDEQDVVITNSFTEKEQAPDTIKDFIDTNKKTIDLIHEGKQEILRNLSHVGQYYKEDAGLELDQEQESDPIDKLVDDVIADATEVPWNITELTKDVLNSDIMNVLKAVSKVSPEYNVVARKIIKKFNTLKELPEIVIIESKESPEYQKLKEVQGTDTPSAGQYFEGKVYLNLVDKYKSDGSGTVSGNSVEVVLHEILHAASWIEINGTNPKQPKTATYKRLQNLRQQTINYVKRNKDKATNEKWAYALKDVNEFFAYGLSNAEFQQLLKEVKVGQKSTVFSRFTQILQRILSIPSISALTYVLEEGSNILSVEMKGSSADSIDINNFNAKYSHDINAQNSEQLFDDLGLNVFGGSRDSQSHTEHLKTVLNNIVNQVIKPITVKMKDVTGITSGVYVQAQNSVYMNISKAKPYVGNGLEMSAQEVYVHELLHSVLTNGIDESTKWASRELRRMYEKVRGELKVEHFLHGAKDWDSATQQQKDNAQEVFDKTFKYLFENPQGVGIHEFAVYGLSNERFKNALSNLDGSSVATQEDTIMGKLISLLQRALDYLFNKLHHTEGMAADTKLHSLALELIDVDKSHKGLVAQGLQKLENGYGKAMQMLTSAILKPTKAFLESDVIQNSRFETVRNISNIAQAIPNVRFDMFMDANDTVLNNLGVASEGFVRSTLNEIKGRTPKTNYMHRLLRKGKTLIDKVRADMSRHTIEFLNNSFSEKLNPETKQAILKAAIKTDLSSLTGLTDSNGNLRYTDAQLIELMKSDSVLATRINRVISELDHLYPNNRHWYTNMAKNLGYYMATGKTLENDLILNTKIIADLDDVGLTPEGDLTKARELIDELATLTSVKHTSTKYRKEFAKVWEAERRVNPNENGVSVTLAYHSRFKEKSLNEIFDGNEKLMIKGYTKDIVNPRKSFIVSNESNEAELLNLGYVKGQEVVKDIHDPSKGKYPMYFYYSEDHLVQPYMAGAFSLTGKNSKGSNLATNYGQTLDENIDPYIQSIVDIADINISKQANRRLIAQNAARPPVEGSTLVPIYNNNGKVTEYRYIMDESIKDGFLEKNNNFDMVLGAMGASITDKVNSAKQNRQVTEELYQDYLDNYAKEPTKFVALGLGVANKEYREKYMLLPTETRREIRDVWGSDRIYVRAEAIPLLFGERKLSVANITKKDLQGLAGFKKMKAQANNMAAYVLNRHSVRVGEDYWKELVAFAKDRIVIASGIVMMGNIISNFVLLKLLGVPLKEIFRDQAEGLTAAKQYQRDYDELAKLTNDVELKPSLANNSTIKARIADLKNALELNPVSELIQEGVYQSIIEDVEFVDDSYGTQSKIRQFLEPKTEKVPESFKKVFTELTLTKESAVYKFMRDTTQLSDFVGRYALHKHNLRNGMEREASIDMVMDVFINYDLPTHKYTQYGNDIGVTMFTKYFLRIQRVLAHITGNHPDRVLGLVFGEHILNTGLGADLADPFEANAITTGYGHRFNVDPIKLAGAATINPYFDNVGLILPD